jgi:hypothetical protein
MYSVTETRKRFPDERWEPDKGGGDIASEFDALRRVADSVNSGVIAATLFTVFIRHVTRPV